MNQAHPARPPPSFAMPRLSIDTSLRPSTNTSLHALSLPGQQSAPLSLSTHTLQHGPSRHSANMNMHIAANQNHPGPVPGLPISAINHGASPFGTSDPSSHAPAKTNTVPLPSTTMPHQNLFTQSQDTLATTGIRDPLLMSTHQGMRRTSNTSDQFHFVYSEPLKDLSNESPSSNFTRRNSSLDSDSLYQLASAGSISMPRQINRPRSWSDSSNGIISGLAGLGLSLGAPSPQNSFVDFSLPSTATAFGTPRHEWNLDEQFGLLEKETQNTLQQQQALSKETLLSDTLANFGQQFGNVGSAPNSAHPQNPDHTGFHFPGPIPSQPHANFSHLSAQFQQQLMHHGYQDMHAAQAQNFQIGNPQFQPMHDRFVGMSSQQPAFMPFGLNQSHQFSAETVHPPLDPFTAFHNEFPSQSLPQQFAYSNQSYPSHANAHTQPPPSPLYTEPPESSFKRILQNGSANYVNRGGDNDGRPVGPSVPSWVFDPQSQGTHGSNSEKLRNLATTTGSSFSEPAPVSRLLDLSPTTPHSPSENQSPPHPQASNTRTFPIQMQQPIVFSSRASRSIPTPTHVHLSESPSGNEFVPTQLLTVASAPAMKPTPLVLGKPSSSSNTIESVDSANVGSPTRATAPPLRRSAAAPGSLRNKELRTQAAKPYSHPMYEDEAEEYHEGRVGGEGDEGPGYSGFMDGVSGVSGAEDCADDDDGMGAAGGLLGATQIRRKNKGFICPVSGCGKQFMRTYNYKVKVVF
ncbi:hypothetical protein BJ741DRAFT_668560 [Chytriomyces cf. hyalinus JEL632]|nr:hypothetical protein BJ741DRAFT_668560 [Chytriomyces cf. hyalinus JEL632]